MVDGPYRKLKRKVSTGLRRLVTDATRTNEQLELQRKAVERIAVLERQLNQTRRDLESVRHITGALLDDTPRLRRQLEAVRATPEYETRWDDPEPLVSVRIATFNLAEVLVDRALASVRRQTYPRFEVVVVGDGCTDDTEDRIRALGDPRIRFVNLPLRGAYPDPPLRRLVAGSPCMNLAVALAKGTWIAPLDDDDEFEPDHLEVLVAEAIRTRAELVYGNFRVIRPEQEAEEVHGCWPPTWGEFGFQASVYLADLRCFEYDPRCWMLGEPGDMNLRRRMVDAGVRMAWLDRVVTTYYPSLLHRPERGPVSGGTGGAAGA